MGFTDIMKHKTDYLTFEEVQSILDVCIQENDMRYYMLIQTLFRTGRRISEVVGRKPYTTVPGLRPKDIHPDGLISWTILKKNPVYKKNRKGTTKLTEEQYKKKLLLKEYKTKLKPADLGLLKMLRTYIEANQISEGHRIFPLDRSNASKRFKEICGIAGVARPKPVHLHTLRHTFAINFLKKNPNDAAALRQLQMILDHEDIDVTMEYAQFTPYDQQDLLEKMFNEL